MTKPHTMILTFEIHEPYELPEEVTLTSTGSYAIAGALDVLITGGEYITLPSDDVCSIILRVPASDEMPLPNEIGILGEDDGSILRRIIRAMLKEQEGKANA